MECRCTTATEFMGAEAGDYVTSHLRANGEPGLYVCPDTGRRWRLDDSDPEQTRLVQI